ncbi:hypothetical protein FIBSPDRAFT_723809 [Athelia psychrophila]|uniref:Zn(2)-C6 fungal-type domain-containing protein n=1 Tax=Athelia psychrophila TaxID=1759441 RepID=A0A166UJ43_9AGAM|nr:hypothetical protein FIBSPDRAFT_723809 [Fibularhizoctonia sp. CBS 109695]
MHDRELGDRKAILACAECRRSKIKCDRVFPCQSCIRRGCIGHTGTLAAVKGNVILATQAKRLENDVKSYQARINELEAALKARTGGSHPALHQSTLAAQDEPQLYTESNIDAVSDALGSLSIGPDSRAKYHGGSAASEVRSLDNENSWDNDDPTLTCHTVSPEIGELSRAFPMGLSSCPYSTVHLIQYLPPEAKALELVDVYYCNGATKLSPILRSDLMDSIVKPIYGLAGTASIYTIHAHQLSVFFAVLAAGELPDEESVQPTPLARHYYMLSRAAFSLKTIAREANAASVQALLIIIWYLRLSDPKSHEERWLLGGLCVRVSQAAKRDSAAWTRDEDEIERRRVLFWELFTFEAWQSMTTGRPPSMSIRHTNCRFPRDREPFLNSSGNFETGFDYWKLRYAATCLTLSLQHVFCANSPSYSILINVDKELRQSPIPEHLRCPVDASDADCSWSIDPAKASQQYCVSNIHECNLLYIHRSYFAQAMRAEPLDPLQHKYAFSVQAVYASARRLILGMQGLCFYHRSAARRQWFLWSSMFSGCIVLGALVIESTGCSLARDALSALELAGELFETTFGNARSPAITVSTYSLRITVRVFLNGPL